MSLEPLDHHRTSSTPNRLPECDSAPVAQAEALVRFAAAVDRLTQHLLEIGLRLHPVREALGAACGEDRDGMGVVCATVTRVLDDLDLLLDDTARVALTLPAATVIAPDPGMSADPIRRARVDERTPAAR